jgi:hypothetical protein
MSTARDELKEAGEHAKLAARSTLKALRGALDYAIRRLDGDEQARDAAATADAERDVPPARPGDTPVQDDDRVV